MTDTKPNAPTEAELKAKEAAAKAEETTIEVDPTPDAPYPSQAQLDAIRQGQHVTEDTRKKRDLKSAPSAAGYKTR